MQRNKGERVNILYAIKVYTMNKLEIILIAWYAL